MTLEKNSKWWTRILKVFYTAILLLSVTGILIFALGRMVDIYGFGDLSVPLYSASIEIFVIAIIFEIIRRTTWYVLFEKHFLERSFLIHMRLLLGLGVILLLVGFSVQYGIDAPRKAKENSEAYEQYTKAKLALPIAKEKLSSCLDLNAKSGGSLIMTTDKECSRKKEIQRGLYNDCRKYGSYAFCISLYDYEAMNCTVPTLNPKYNSCRVEYADVNMIESIIENYEKKNNREIDI